MINSNFLRSCCMFPVIPTESQRRYLQPKDGMWSFGADRANHILDWRTSLGRFHCASALNFSVPPGKAHPDWSFMVQITGLLASPASLAPKFKQTGHSLFRHRNQERVHKREHIKQKETEEGDCSNEIPLNIQNTQKIPFHWKVFASLYCTEKVRDAAVLGLHLVKFRSRTSLPSLQPMDEL